MAVDQRRKRKMETKRNKQGKDMDEHTHLHHTERGTAALQLVIGIMTFTCTDSIDLEYRTEVGENL